MTRISRTEANRRVSAYADRLEAMLGPEDKLVRAIREDPAQGCFICTWNAGGLERCAAHRAPSPGQKAAATLRQRRSRS